MIRQGRMAVCRVFLLLCLPGHFAVSIPRILNVTVGGTLGMKCLYSVGEEGHRKFWCRGPNWKDCVRVIETTQRAGQEVRHGRVTLQDSPREHFFLVIMEDLEEGDADTYWCGVDRGRGVPQAPAAVTVFPGSVTVAVRPTEAPASPGALALTSRVSSPGLPAWPFLLFASFLFLALLKVILFLSFSYAAIWLAWLQHHL
ncbi:CMRF35-like molecule 6 [Manis pentadactyla]|uniref:CMRF35-like molecule 6 n=1 Tax=Manis pentadactyla TaxID=143292 RepID=UPI00255D0D69|nr:CMRF35-like molecule 6 [Manis pentadactyla]XP_057357666.1 CMRF35-like molecule 6 [Manis pentadactyla]